MYVVSRVGCIQLKVSGRWSKTTSIEGLPDEHVANLVPRRDTDELSIICIPPLPRLHILSLEASGLQTRSIAHAIDTLKHSHYPHLSRLQIHIYNCSANMDTWKVLEGSLLRLRARRHCDMRLLIDGETNWENRVGLWLDWLARGQMILKGADVFIVIDLLN